MRISHESLHVTPALPEDLADLNYLMAQLTANPAYIGVDMLRDVLGDGCILVARDADVASSRDRTGKIVSMATLLFGHTLHGLISYTHDVITDRDYLKRGISTGVMNHLIGVAHSWKVKHIDLTSNPARTEAHKLYLKLGFEQRDTNVFRKKLA